MKKYVKNTKYGEVYEEYEDIEKYVGICGQYEEIYGSET